MSRNPGGSPLEHHSTQLEVVMEVFHRAARFEHVCLEMWILRFRNGAVNAHRSRVAQHSLIHS